MIVNEILKDDSLLPLLILPRTLNSHKFVQKISYFYLSFMLMTVVADGIVVALTNQWNLIASRYTSLGGGFFIVLTSYVALYHPKVVAMTLNTYNQIFPSLWPLDFNGCRHKFEKMATLTKIGALLMIVGVLVIATAGLPWYGNEYDVYFPVKVAVDYLNKFALNVYLFFFYTLFYHSGFTVLSNVFYLTYFILHLYNQFCMLSEKLRTLSDSQRQELVTQDLISCIKLHQTLFEYTEILNTLLYYPIYFYSASGVIIGLVIILCPSNTPADLLRATFLALFTISAAAGCCFLGQILENSSEEIFNSVYGTPWYAWNFKNKKLVLVFLQLSQRKAVLSSSGLITINHQLLIGLFQAIYSYTTFLIQQRDNKH